MTGLTRSKAPNREFKGLPDFDRLPAAEPALARLAVGAAETLPASANPIAEPVVSNEIPDQHLNEDNAVNFQFAADSFTDLDGHQPTYSATLSDDSPLPSWLTFTAATRTFSGTPPLNFNGIISLKVAASDGSLSASDTFDLIVDPVNDAPTVTIFSMLATAQGGEVRVNTQTRYDQVDPKVTALAGGGYVVTWTSYYQDGSDAGIFAQLYDAGGVRIGGEVQVNTIWNDAQYEPSIAGLTGGGYVIVWSDSQDDDGNIRGQRFDASGAKAGGEFAVNADPNEKGGAAITGLADGGFVVVWGSSGDEDEDDHGVYAMRYDANGVALDMVTLAVPTEESYADIAVSALPGGGYVVAWIVESDFDGPGESIYVGRFNADGTPIAAMTRVDGMGAFERGDLSIATLTGGGFVIVWESQGQDGGTSGIYARRYDANGAAVDVETRINLYTPNDQDRPSVTALSDGGYVISWQSIGQEGSGNSGIYSRRFTANGAAVGLEVHNNTTTLNQQTSPSVAGLQGTGYIVVWSSLRQDGSLEGIYAQRYAAAVEQQAYNLKTRIAVADVDGGAGIITVTISVDYGLLNATVGGSGATIVSGNGTGTLVLSGTAVQIEGLLRADATSTITYTAHTDAPPLTATLTVLVDDGGNSGSGIPLTATASTTIGITPVPDGPTVTIDPMGSAREGVETLVNTSVSSQTSTPAVGKLVDGGYVVTWTAQSIDGDLAGVYAQRFDVAGNPVDPEFLVNVSTTNNQNNGVVVGLLDGGFVIVWQSNHGANGDDIYMRRYDSDGNPQSGETIVNATVISAQTQPSVALLENGSLVVGWNGVDVSGGGYFARVFDQFGNPLANEFAVNQTTAGTQANNSNYAIAGLWGGGFVVTWQSPDANLNGIYARRFNSAGIATSNEFQVNSTTADNQQSSAVVALWGGGFVIVWQSNLQDGSSTGVYGQLYSAAYVPVGGEFLINTYTTGLQTSPAVAALSDGGFVVTWTSDAQDGSSAGVYSQRFSGSGARIGGEMLVNSFTVGIQAGSNVGALDNGRFVVTWASTNQAGPAQTDIYTQRYGYGYDAEEGEGFSLKNSIFIDDPDGVVAGAPLTDVGTMYDPLPGELEVILSVDNGTLTVTAGGSGATVSGSGTATVVITGTLAQIKALLTTDATSTVLFLPAGDAPPASVSFHVSVDDGENVASASQAISIAPVNDAPVVSNAIADQHVDEDAALNFQFDAGVFDDPDGTALTYTASLANDDPLPAWLVFTAATRTFSGTPPANFNGTISVKVTASDGSLSVSDTFDLIVDPVDDASVAAADSGTVAENGNLILFVRANDSDIDGPVAAVAAIDGTAVAVGGSVLLASGARVTRNADGTLTYDTNGAFGATPAPGSGASNTPASDSFTYTLAGGGTATVSMTITGLDTNDILIGTAGADTLDGGTGLDQLIGLAGDDAYFADNGDVVTEATGGGNDRIFARSSYVLTAGSEVERMSTADHAGTAAINLTGNALSQLIFGNAGNNVLDSGGGGDELVGLGGDDSFHVGAGDVVTEYAGGGNDRVYARSDYALISTREIETLSTDNDTGTDARTLIGNELTQTIIGNAGFNILDSSGGGDTLRGLAGDDWYYVRGGDLIEEASNGGSDRLFAFTSYVLNAGASVELMSTTDHGGTSAINLTGNELAQTIYGNAGDNIIDGGLGADILLGFGGANTFQFTTALGNGNVDRILDFVSGTDRISLDDAVFTGLSTGALPAGAFTIGTAAADADDRIVYHQATGRLYFDADGNGAGAAVQFATLNAGQTLTASDFVVI